MGSHPANLAWRFLLELLALGSMGYWGWTQHDGIGRWLWVIGLPVLTAVLWGTFAAAVMLLRASQQNFLSGALAVMVIVHYALSYDRIIWLWRN